MQLSLSPRCTAAIKSASLEAAGGPISTWHLLRGLMSAHQDIRTLLTVHMAAGTANVSEVKEEVEPEWDETFTQPAYRALKMMHYEVDDEETPGCAHLLRALAREKAGRAGLFLRQIQIEKAIVETDPVLAVDPPQPIVTKSFMILVAYSWLCGVNQLTGLSVLLALLAAVGLTGRLLARLENREGPRSGPCAGCGQSFPTPAAYCQQGAFCLACKRKRCWRFGLGQSSLSLLILTVGVALFYFGYSKAGYLLLNCGLLGPFLFLAIVVHEFGHVLSARLVGWSVWKVELGKGPPGPRFNLGYCSLEFRASLYGGRTYAVPVPPGSNRRFALLVLGGPLANLACSAFIFSATTPWHDWISPERGVLLLPLAALTHLWLGLSNLYPTVGDQADSLPSDGQLLVQCWKEVITDGQLSLSRKLSMVHAYQDKDWPALSRLLALESKPPFILAYALALRERRWKDAVALCAEAGPLADSLAETNFNNLAWALLCEGRDLERAEALIQQALLVAPNYSNFLGTQGCLYMLTGREAEGALLLRTLLSRPICPKSASVNALFLSRVDPQWLQVARMLDPGSPYEDVAFRVPSSSTLASTDATSAE